jgi:T5SS/PEP-CTERM-associated repeat protein
MLLAAPALRAQIVSDGATKTLINDTNTFTGDVTVGTNGSFTLLILSDNALLTNSAQGVIGRNVTARSNEVRLVSASARWRMGGSIFVGLNGAANQLTVSNGGVVTANVGDVGLVPTSSNNVAVVTGSGSLWSNALELVFGFDSAGNQMVISNGGMVRNGVGYLGNTASANNNLVVVTDPDSVWTNGSVLNVGYNGASGNQLRVSNGGRVVNSDGFIGFNATSRSNTVLVTGSGSTWNNLTNLTVGNNGSGNLLIASNGATVFTSGDSGVGANSGAKTNSVLITGSGSRWLSGAMSSLFVGSNGSFNQMIISGGALVADRDGYVGLGSGGGGSNNTVSVFGAGSRWSNSSALTVGSFSSGNRLTIGISGLVEDDSGTIGAVSSAGNNVVVVSDPGSTWSNRFSTSVIRGVPAAWR